MDIYDESGSLIGSAGQIAGSEQDKTIKQVIDGFSFRFEGREEEYVGRQWRRLYLYIKELEAAAIQPSPDTEAPRRALQKALVVMNETPMPISWPHQQRLMDSIRESKNALAARTELAQPSA